MTIEEMGIKYGRREWEEYKDGRKGDSWCSVLLNGIELIS